MTYIMANYFTRPLYSNDNSMRTVSSDKRLSLFADKTFITRNKKNTPDY